ncbi:MAG: hypothetical protein PHQ54_03950, partial [Candidatus Omnitrophica bacterium]|nr:hypothetical protein [Candidatus Omnitrophota bacterium]
GQLIQDNPQAAAWIGNGVHSDNYRPVTNSPGYREFIANLVVRVAAIEDKSPQESSALDKLTQNIIGDTPNRIHEALFIMATNKNASLEAISGATGIDRDLLSELQSMNINPADIKSIDPVGCKISSSNNGKWIIAFVNANGKTIHITSEKFMESTAKEIAHETDIPIATIEHIKENLLEDGKNIGFTTIVLTDGTRLTVSNELADTIVYINSTNPVEIAKEVLKRVLVSRPNTSDAVVNKMFLLMVIFGLICVGFGVTLAVYITKAQLKRSDYFSPVLGGGKSFQHNYAANIKLK